MENGTENSRDAKLEESIAMLRTWLQKQPHMPQNIDEELLVPFICGTKSLQRAKEKLESFCMMHSRYPHSFSFECRDPFGQIKEFYKMGKMFMLPKTTPEGYRVFMAICDDFETFDGFWSNAIMSMVLETEMILHPNSPGLFLVFDCNKVVDSRIMVKMGLSATSFLLQYLQQGIPRKMKKMVVFNTPSFFDVFVNTVVKPYAKKKLFDRIIFTSNGDEVLKEYLPLEILPSDVGGGMAPTAKEIDDEWKRILESRRHYFKNAPNLATDESKRLPDTAHTYGVDGTFRMLSVD